ncbi:hypothetical protein [Methanobrevibacter arboriphilus]|nr:hypothetical protein [Methanobrevibacter arboriphilus]
MEREDIWKMITSLLKEKNLHVKDFALDIVLKISDGNPALALMAILL